MTCPLEEWIDITGLRDLVQNEMPVHMSHYALNADDIEGLTRLIMISLRQALNLAEQEAVDTETCKSCNWFDFTARVCRSHWRYAEAHANDPMCKAERARRRLIRLKESG